MPEDAYFIAYEDDFYYNKTPPDAFLKVFEEMNINSLLVALPMEPYREIVKEITRSSSEDCIVPSDSETRTFLHEIPIVESQTTDLIVQALRSNKACVTRDGYVITHGSVSPEQCFVSFSSVCFALFVKYLYDSLELVKSGVSPDNIKVLQGLLSQLRNLSLSPETSERLNQRPTDPDGIIQAIEYTGKLMVELGLVDSYFGNISSCHEGKIYITQTGSSLDELQDRIDVVPYDGTSTTGITASSEFSTHRAIYERTDFRYVLHGHPKFTVVLSMLCPERLCRGDACYRTCSRDRYIGNVPVVSGEIGTGRYGIVNTVPEVMSKVGAVVVFGHGVFTASTLSLADALQRMVDIENHCIKEFRSTIRSL